MELRSKTSISVGSVCSIVSKYLRHVKLISGKYPNIASNHGLEGLIVIEDGHRTTHKKDADIILMWHDDFENILIYCVRKWLTVE